MSDIFEPGSTDDLIVKLLDWDRITRGANEDNYRAAAEKREETLQRLRAAIAALSSHPRGNIDPVSSTGESQ